METPTLPDSQVPMDAVDGTPRLETTALSEQPDNQLGQFSDGPSADDLPADEPTAEEPPAGQAGGKRSESEEPQEQVVPASQDQKVQCQKCLSQVYVYDAQARGKVWWCKPCNAINSMLRRNLSWPPAEFSALDSDAQAAFWQRCQAAKDAAGEGRLRYDRLRDVLITSLTTQVTNELTKKSCGEFLPLSVYKQRLGCKALFAFPSLP